MPPQPVSTRIAVTPPPMWIIRELMKVIGTVV
jgi:hypothetical protein